jgi:hypothetical protein
MKWNVISKAINQGGLLVGAGVALAVVIATYIYKRFIE